MKKLATAVLAAAMLGSSAIALAPAAQASNDKVTICHATGVDGKYTTNTISKDGTANGHAGLDHQDGRDIIPAYSWVEDQVRHYFEGQNLDKAYLLDQGCKELADSVTASPVGPKYVPATCAAPELPYGRVVVPGDLGVGVAGASEPALNADNTEWSVQYTLAADTEEIDYSWPAGVDGSYKFTVVPLSADANWVVDSKTGVGQCELPDTGAEDWYMAAGVVGGAAILLGAATKIRRRRLA
jgi:LPXTG-motif cell wall-anchored protein